MWKLSRRKAMAAVLASGGAMLLKPATALHAQEDQPLHPPDPLPRGTILPYFNPAGMIPPGWALCDGNNGTPNLINTFLRGVNDHTQIGQRGGTETHNHVVTKHRDRPDGNYPMGEGDRCYFTDTTTVNHLPPYVNVFYIMKIG